MNIANEFAANVVKTGFANLDKETVEKAKLRITDVIGCAIAGANAPGCDLLLKLVKRWGGAGETTVLVHGGKYPAHNAAMMNSMMTRSFDFEPVEAGGEKSSSPAHISGTTAPTALGVAEMQGSSGKDLITALVLGDDIASRLGVASGFDFDLGWDNTGTINRFGAAAITGKLMKFNEKQMFNAFGIVLNEVAGSMAGVFDKTLCFKLPISLASRDGIFAAELAKEGYPGVKDPFTGKQGYFRLYCRTPNTTEVTKDLGKKFYADIVIKPYSACRSTHSPIDSALKIVRANDINPEDIEEVIIQMNPATHSGFVGQPLDIGDWPQVDCAFSIRYTVACALLRKNVKPEYFSAESIQAPEIKKLVDKTQLLPTLAKERRFASEMQVKMKNGKVYSAVTEVPSGVIADTPAIKEDVIAKYRSNVAYSKTVSIKNAEKALALLDKLEKVDNINEIIQLAVKE